MIADVHFRETMRQIGERLTDAAEFNTDDGWCVPDADDIGEIIQRELELRGYKIVGGPARG